jgi:hypothetical protein
MVLLAQAQAQTQLNYLNKAGVALGELQAMACSAIMLVSMVAVVLDLMELLLVLHKGVRVQLELFTQHRAVQFLQEFSLQQTQGICNANL